MAPASASAVPPSLKKVKVFLSRASELDRDSGNPESRVAAYNCRQYAVLSGIPLAGDAASKSFLGELLDGLEGEKAIMASFSKEEHWKICRKVADKVFERADAEDRGGVANKGTARTFYAAGTFYEILQQFYDKNKDDAEADISEEVREQMDEEEQRRVYCKWKATEILNAIKEGRTPAPGGYQEQEDAEVEAAVDAALGGAGGGLPPIDEGLAPVDEGPPPAPSPPRAPSPPPPEPVGGGTPPPYDGFELSLNGRPTPTVEDVKEGEDSGDEVFIPGAVKNAAADDANNIFVSAPSPAPAAPPPAYSSMSAIPPPAASRPLPPPTAEPSSPSGGGMFSSLFGHSSSSSKKLSKEQMADAVELTKFALAALQKGDSELGRERLEQALGLWRSKSKKNGKARKKLSGRHMEEALEYTKLTLAALHRGDAEEAKQRLKQALGAWS